VIDTVRATSGAGVIISLLAVYPNEVFPQEPYVTIYREGVSIYELPGPELGTPVFAGLGSTGASGNIATVNFGAAAFAYPGLAAGANWP
jgi:hypothetical protein